VIVKKWLHRRQVRHNDRSAGEVSLQGTEGVENGKVVRGFGTQH